MTETTKRLIIAAVAATLAIAGSVAVMALVDDSDDEDRGLSALTEAIDDDRDGGDEDVLLDMMERFFSDEGASAFPELLFDFLDELGDDLLPLSRDGTRGSDTPQGQRDRDQAPERDGLPPGFGRPFRGDGPDALPFDGFGFRFDPDGDAPFDLPFFEGSPFEALLEDGRLSPAEARALQEWFLQQFGALEDGFAFGLPDFSLGDPDEKKEPKPDKPPKPDKDKATGDREFALPCGDGRLDEFLEDGRISPEEARELERLFRESFGGGVFRFQFVPPETDRLNRGLPDGLLESLGDLPFREFFSDGELTPREREALREALNDWLDRIFERF